MIQTALKYDLEVRENGRVELQVPLPTRSRVTVFVVQESPRHKNLWVSGGMGSSPSM